jgi:hypothetical protein
MLDCGGNAALLKNGQGIGTAAFVCIFYAGILDECGQSTRDIYPQYLM